MNSAVVCSVCQPAQEGTGAQAETATVLSVVLWGCPVGRGAMINTCVNGASKIWVLPQCSQAFIMLFKLTKSYTAAKISLPVNKLKINWYLSNIIHGLE